MGNLYNQPTILKEQRLQLEVFNGGGKVNEMQEFDGKILNVCVYLQCSPQYVLLYSTLFWGAQAQQRKVWGQSPNLEKGTQGAQPPARK